jgi:inner membrane protein
MASLPGHAIAVLGMGAVVAPPDMPRRLWVWAVALSLAPDVDAVAFGLGIPYAHPWGHRGLSHSVLAAALMAGAALAMEYRRKPQLALGRTGAFLFLAALSHGLLDACTNGGLGVGFWLPFRDHRYFFPWRPILVSPIGSAFFSARGLRVLASEAFWIGLPAASLGLLGWGLRRVRDPKAQIV